jgi:hypothetical protein
VVWLDQHTVTLPNVMIPQATLINAFNKHLADTHKAVITKKAFGQALRRARPEIVDSQRTFNGKAHTWVYEGITIRTAYSTERRERDERD